MKRDDIKPKKKGSNGLKGQKSKLSKDGCWKSFRDVPGLLQYVTTGTFYGRIKVSGKLIRNSLETNVWTTAKLRLLDFQKKHQSKKTFYRNPVTFGDALVQYEHDTEIDPALSASAKRYRGFCVKKIRDGWPKVLSMKAAKISPIECREFFSKLAQQISPHFFNIVLGTFRTVLKKMGAVGADDPTAEISRLSVQQKKLHLPEADEFQAIIRTVDGAGSRHSKHCAHFIRFLAFSGCRLSEARKATWEDVDLKGGMLTVHSAKLGLSARRGKNRPSTRLLPIIPPMRELLMELKDATPNLSDPICVVGECEKSMTSACTKLGVHRITHHDLRHLFATRCIESGVDIPTVSRWLGHVDGGALAMKIYGHLRTKHSLEMAAKVTFDSQPQVREAA